MANAGIEPGMAAMEAGGIAGAAQEDRGASMITWSALQADGGDQTSSFEVNVPHECVNLNRFRKVLQAEKSKLQSVDDEDITFSLLKRLNRGQPWQHDRDLEPDERVPQTNNQHTLLLVKYPPSAIHDPAATTGTAATGASGVAQLTAILDATRLESQRLADATCCQELAVALSPSHDVLTSSAFSEEGQQFAESLKLRVSTAMYTLLVSAAPSMANRLQDTGVDGGTDVKSALLAALVQPGVRIAESSENIVVACVDNITRPIFEDLGAATVTDKIPFHTQVTRNVKGSTAQSPPDNKQRSTATPVQGKKRLDMYVVASQQLVFFGEEESSTSDEHAEAQLANEDRIVFSAASFGTAPFVVVYVCTGPIFKFYLFSRRAVEEDRPKVEQIWRGFDLREVTDRLEVLFRLVFVFKWLRSAVLRFFPSQPMPIDKHVSVVLGAVEKKVEDMSHDRQQQLTELHTALVNAPNSLARATLSGPTASNPICCITVTPVGFHSEPTTVEEAKAAFVDVLTALSWLHETAKWVHCDLRWPNVLRQSVVKNDAHVKGGWMLIDYEMSQPMSHASWPSDLKDEFQPPDHEERWEPRDDLWQFFNLIVAKLAASAGHDTVTTFCNDVRKFEGETTAHRVLERMRDLTI